MIKFPRFFQSLFYFLGYDREQICEEDTNKLWWKKAKDLINDELYERIQAYTPIGPKDGSFKKYQVINFIERNLESIDHVEMEQYSWYLSKYYKWILTMIEYRKEDVMKRRAVKTKEREEREHALNESNEREALKNQKREEAINEFELKADEEMAARRADREAARAANEGEGEGEEIRDEDLGERPKFDDEAFN